jgi:predicted transcriptional regulator
MTVLDIAKKMDMKVLTGETGLDRKISGVYICDLLSWVISRAKENDLWITVLTNLNIVAAAVLSEVSCIVVPEGISVEEATIRKAIIEGIPVLSSKLSAYDICKQLIKMGL